MSLTDKYNIILDDFESFLCLSMENNKQLTIEDIQENLGKHYKNLKNKQIEEKSDKALLVEIKRCNSIKKYHDQLKKREEEKKEKKNSGKTLIKL